MATINLGNIKFTWQGAYDANTAYTIDDVVSYNGSSYVCIQASTGNLPTVTTHWNIMSSAGTNGTNGTDLTSTLTAQGDILYRDGSGLAKLGAGTSGQFLKTSGTGANPVWANAGGGMMSLVTRTAVTSNSNNVTFTNLEANNYHKFIFQGIDSTDNSGEDFCLQFSSDNGSNWLATSYYSTAWQTYNTGSTNNNTVTNASYPRIADGFHTSGTDEGLHGECTISNIGNGQRPCAWWHTVHKADSSNILRQTNGGTMMMNGATINAIKFFFDAGSISGSSYAFITHYKGVIA